jgi:uncharacterized protein (DUF885 family)
MLSDDQPFPTSFECEVAIVDDAWAELCRTPYVQQKLDLSIDEMPDLSFEEAQRRSRVGLDLLDRIACLKPVTRPHHIELLLRLVSCRAGIWVREADWYWKVIDPRGIGAFGMFLPTAYCGGYILSLAHQRLAAFKFETGGDLDRYLALLIDYSRLIGQFTNRTEGQRQRGMLMPRAQLEPARRLLESFCISARAAVGVDGARLAGIASAGFCEQVEHCSANHIEPAYRRAIAMLGPDYEAQAPETVGISQYQGGADLYLELARLHTTLDQDPDQIHRYALDRMARIEDGIGDISAELGFNGDQEGFDRYLRNHPDWQANNVDDLSRRFQRYIDRVAPILPSIFERVPESGYSVAPLAEALRPSMAFGYYDPPTKGRPTGLYMFNPDSLIGQPVCHLAALCYHELAPGHHLHISLQETDQGLHPFQAFSFVNAYVEGWAEYAATLAGELGLYHAPEERYGRLVMDSFLTSRLVVDTGLNARGWTLERGRDYLRRHSRLSEREIRSETLRYSCDRPGQVLAYKLGDEHILGLRQRMQNAFGSRFELKAFHSAVLGAGAMPFDVLDWHLDHKIRELSEQNV